jgi:hypothetical protein
VFIKVDGTSFTEMFAANDWKPFQFCLDNFVLKNVKNRLKSKLVMASTGFILENRYMKTFQK